MRMWLGADPPIMCRQHLLGEWREHFTIIGSLKKKLSFDGFIKNDLIELRSLTKRHRQLKKEMGERGYNAKSGFDFSMRLTKYLPPRIRKHRIDRQKSLSELLSRCPKCKERYRETVCNNI